MTAARAFGLAGSLDVIYSHASMASLLSTRLPEGVDISRGYDDRGWVRLHRCTIEPHTEHARAQAPSVRRERVCES